jgi:hypothetical protein
MQAEDIQSLPDDLRLVLATVGRGMSRRRLTPELVEATKDAWENLIPGQVVAITHGARNSSDAHHYLVEIKGDRWAGATWRFRSGVFEVLARTAARDETL